MARRMPHKLQVAAAPTTGPVAPSSDPGENRRRAANLSWFVLALSKDPVHGSEAAPHPSRQDQAAAVPHRRRRRVFARDGRFIEILGHYNPRTEPSTLSIDNDKAVKWLSQGAQPTDRVRKLLEISGALEQFGSSKSS